MILEYKVTDIEWDKGPYDCTRMVKLPQEAAVSVAFDLSWLKPAGKVNGKEVRQGIRNILEEKFNHHVLSFKTRLIKKEADNVGADKGELLKLTKVDSEE